MEQRLKSSNRTLAADVESNMRLFTRLLVLSTALLLALPPGWCCTVRADEGTAKKSESNVPSCCQSRHDDSKPTTDSSTPSNPHRNCQCCWAAESSTAPTKTALPDVTLFTLPLPIVAAPISLPCIVEPVEIGLISAAPPLHVLLCTWVC